MRISAPLIRAEGQEGPKPEFISEEGAAISSENRRATTFHHKWAGRCVPFAAAGKLAAESNLPAAYIPRCSPKLPAKGGVCAQDPHFGVLYPHSANKKNRTTSFPADSLDILSNDAAGKAPSTTRFPASSRCKVVASK